MRIRKIDFDIMAYLMESAFNGVVIIAPSDEKYNYEDAYADMYVKVADIVEDNFLGNVSTCKLHADTKELICNGDERLYFRHNGRKYCLDDFMISRY